MSSSYPSSYLEQIVEVEERLRNAMLGSDYAVLDELVSSDLVFTTHIGQVLGKQEDLAAHRSGILKFHRLQPSEMRIRAEEALAVVSVRMQAAGTWDGAPFAEDLRITRIWRRLDGAGWQIIAGHSSRVQQ